MPFPALPALLPLVLNRYVGAAVLAAGAWWGFVQYRDGLIQSGYDTAMEEVRAFNDDRKREQQREVSRLIELVRQLEKDNAANEKMVADFNARHDDLADKLRAQERDFDAKLKRASAEAVREYAKAVDGNLEGCRLSLKRFAGEAASCSGTAHTLKNYVDQTP